MIEAADVSAAWVLAMEALVAKGGEDFHAIVTIADPCRESADVRALVDELLSTLNDRHPDEDRFKPVQTVHDTIFPAGYARVSSSAEDLAARYLMRWEHRRRFAGIQWGTYFHRIVASPTTDGGVINQLAAVIEKLSRPTARFKTAFEIDFGIDELEHSDILISRRHKDGLKVRGLPCLSYVSFQRDGDKLHGLGFYRNNHLISKAYGNYLGLGDLLAYVAAQSGLQTGMLTIVAGHAEIDKGVPRNMIATVVHATSAALARPPAAS